MILGALNIKDYFAYKKGSFATEMPLWMRPQVKKVINKMTSPAGAFVIGFLVTLFLLPCTIGPYIVASGLLAELGIMKALPPKNAIDLAQLYFLPAKLDEVKSHFPLVILLIKKSAQIPITICREVRMAMVT